MTRFRVARVAALAVGLALMAAPALFGYAGSPASDLHRTIGPVAAAVAATALWRATAGIRWVELGAAAALMGGAAGLVPHDPAARAVAISGGAALFLAPFVRPTSAPSLGGGWRSAVGLVALLLMATTVGGCGRR